ncbi:MAG: threonine/serine dehydratase [Marmoricola sp.]|nr:threonine/serine dehydratase [Marmoricola sp.]
MSGHTNQLSVPTYDDIERAGRLIAPWVRRTPTLDVEVDGRAVTLKLELMQHAGSFKVRGAFTSVMTAPEPPATLVAASGGNHGLAVAYVGDALAIPTRVFVPQNAPAVKVDAIASLGAEVNQVGSTYAEAFEASLEAASRPGVLALHAYDAWGTVTGQGTLGLEIAEQVPDADTVLVAVGGGGLIAGVTRGLAGTRPSARVVAVEPEACPTLQRALGHGGPVDVAVGGVAADALGASSLGAIAWDTVQEYGTSSVLVTDEAISDARRWLWRTARIAAEPAGAAALASLLSGVHQPLDHERVCVVVCGGNADPSGLS